VPAEVPSARTEPYAEHEAPRGLQPPQPLTVDGTARQALDEQLAALKNSNRKLQTHQRR